MVFIIIKNDNILTVCENLDVLYHNILSYARIILYCDKNKINFFQNLKIIEYQSGCPINSYHIDSNNLDLYDENNNKITINNSTINMNKVELEILFKKDVESEINMFIPLDLNESDETSINPDIYVKSNYNNINKTNNQQYQCNQQYQYDQQYQSHNQQYQSHNQCQSNNQCQLNNHHQLNDLQFEQIKHHQ